MLFKDFSLETSFFGLLPIAIPFRKALDSPVLVVPRCGLKTQWLINRLWNTEDFAKMHFFSESNPHFFSFLTCRLKNLNFLLSKQRWILKLLQFLIFRSEGSQDLALSVTVSLSLLKSPLEMITYWQISLRNGYWYNVLTWILTTILSLYWMKNVHYFCTELDSGQF